LFFTTKSRPNARIYTIPAEEEEEEASHNLLARKGSSPSHSEVLCP
jgi:hypothetical protein